MFAFFPLRTPEKQTCLTAPVETCQYKLQTMSYNTYNITSLTNHWQKAGPIHSLAWTPQSIHTAFFWWRFFFPTWQGQKHHDQSGMCAFACLSLWHHSPRASSHYFPLIPGAHKAVSPRTTSQWRTCQPGGAGFCSFQTSSLGSKWKKRTDWLKKQTKKKNVNWNRNLNLVCAIIMWQICCFQTTNSYLGKSHIFGWLTENWLCGPCVRVRSRKHKRMRTQARASNGQGFKSSVLCGFPGWLCWIRSA